MQSRTRSSKFAHPCAEPLNEHEALLVHSAHRTAEVGADLPITLSREVRLLPKDAFCVPTGMRASLLREALCDAPSQVRRS